MKKTMKLLLVILLVLLALTVTILVAVQLYRHFVTNRIMDRGGMENPFPPERNELPVIPGDATLNSLSWGQSASNEYECFVFDLHRGEDGHTISGKYLDPDGDLRVSREGLPLTDEQRLRIEQCLRSEPHCAYEEPAGDEVYDETSSLLSVSWYLSDGTLLSTKYDGRGESELLTLLKTILQQ